MAVQATLTAKNTSNGIRSGIEGTWVDARTAAIAAKSLTTFVTQAAVPFQCGRYFGLFDVTSEVPRHSKVISVTFVHPAIGNFSNDDSAVAHVIEHTAGDPVATGDFLDITLNGDTSFGSETFANINSGGANITLNASGILVVQTAVKNGTLAKLGLRSNRDIDNNIPSGNSQYTMSVTTAQLIITYNPPQVLIFTE